MRRRLNAIACSMVLALVACSSASEPGGPSGSTQPSPDNTPADGEEGPGSEETVTPGTGTDPDSEPPPVRPEPQATVRDCGRALTQPTALSPYTQWVSFKPTKIGAQAISKGNGEAVFGNAWATGTASRPSTAATALASTGADANEESVRDVLGLRDPDELGSNGLFNGPAGGNGEQARLFYVAPTTTILTFVDAWSATEVGWTIAAPKRTPQTGPVGSDQFVRTLIPGRFFGYEMTLLFPDTCAVGALGDALGRPALLRDATPDTGIFEPAKMAAAQEVLVKNGVKMQVRLTSNKPVAAVESLLSSTTCSPGNLAACKTLLEDLRTASNAARSAAPSDLAKVQNGTDPTWSTLEVAVSPVSILEP